MNDAIQLGLRSICVYRSISWKVFFSLGLIYSSAYATEWLLWTSKAKERALKKQFAAYAKSQLQTLKPLLSSHCRDQAQKELHSTLVLVCGAAEGAGLEIKAELEGIEGLAEGARKVVERGEDSTECALEMEEIIKSLSRKIQLDNRR